MYKHQLTNPKLAYVVAAITGDGHLQIKDWRYSNCELFSNLDKPSYSQLLIANHICYIQKSIRSGDFWYLE